MISSNSNLYVLCIFCSLFPTSEGIQCTILYMLNIPDGCTVWDGDLIIYGNTETFPYWTQKLSSVTAVNGRVSILGTNFQNFSFLSSLEKIYYKPQYDFKSSRDTKYAQGTNYPFRVENNLNLERLEMNKLKSVVIDVLPTDKSFYATSFPNNPKLCFHSNQTQSWMNSIRVRIPQLAYCDMKIIEQDNYFKKFTVGNDSRIFCSMEWFNASMPMGCQILDTGIWVKNALNETALEYFSTAIQSVEMMFGPIIVKNSSSKRLNFANLRAIYNMHAEATEISGGWSMQAMQIINNDLLTELLFPKLEHVDHFGPEAFVITSGNSQLECAIRTCDILLQFFRFDLNSCACGVIPRFNPGYSILYLLLVIFESLLCAVVTILVYGNIIYYVYKTRYSVSYFQFSMLMYIWLCCIEAVYNVLNNIKFFDGLNYPWFVGVQFILFSNKERYFYQTVNIIYTNRISLLLSCCLYRTISFISFDYGKVAMAVSFVIFICSNIWNFNNLLQSALLSFIFCGFPDGIFEPWLTVDYKLGLIRSRRVFSYYYSSTIIRWHYLAYALLLRLFLHDMISKVNLRSTAQVATTIKSIVAVGVVGTTKMR